MIKDKDMGLKVAENEDVALWESLRAESEALIKQSERHIKVQKAINSMARAKLRELDR